MLGNLIAFWRSLTFNTRNWFKGADTTSLLIFLEKILPEKIADLSDEVAKELFHWCLAAISSANVFLKVLYHASLWLTMEERRTLIRSGCECVDAFLQCAEHSYQEGITRFKLQPKLHMFGEIILALQVQEKSSKPSINPLAWATQQDEDFVGRICTFSRSVSIRTIHKRTLSRYQVALAALLWKETWE